MNPRTLRRTARLAANVASIIIAHPLGDQYVQDGTDAVNKGKPGPAGRTHCLRHVISYTLTHAATQPSVNAAMGIPTKPGAWLLGHGATGLAHYVMDRSRDSATLITTMDRLTAEYAPWLPQKTEYWKRGGQVELDQAWHWSCLGIWAVLDAVATER